MSPLFMDTGYEPNSPDSDSAGSERQGEGPPLGKTGTKRRAKNRDAARKSRRKQTERADELHEELQSLERSNSALQKEIATLKKDLHLYTTALEHHEPYCCIKAPASSSSSSTCRSVSPSAGCGTSSSPPRVCSQASNSALLAVPSLPTSLSSSLGLQTIDCVENTHRSPSTSATTTIASSSCSSADLFITPSSSPLTVPYSLSFSTLPAPHSVFSQKPPITSRPSDVTDLTPSFVSNFSLSSNLTIAAEPESVEATLIKTSALSTDAYFSTQSDTLDAFLTKQSSYLNVSSNVPPYSRAATENAVQGSCKDTGHYRENLKNLSPPRSHFPLSLQDPDLQPVSISHQESLEPLPAPAFAFKPSSSRQITPNRASLLSFLTVPSPLNVSETTSSRFDRLVSQPSPSLPLLSDPSRDLSLSELLEVNDWILGGSSNQ